MDGCWIRDAELIAPEGRRRVDVRLEGGVIAEVRAADGPSAEVEPGDVDARGRWLLPGGVDVHTHFGMPLRRGLMSRGWRESSTAALLGGTTTVVDFANPDRDEPLGDAVARWQAAAAGDCLCDHAFHVTVCTVDDERLAEIPDLVADGLPTFKAFLAYEGRLMLSPDELRRLMEAVRDAGARLLLHAEDGVLNARLERELAAAGHTAPRHHPEAHPADSEAAAAATAIDLARATGCPLTIVHLSTAGTLAAVTAARDAGVDVNAEVCTQHLWRTDEWYARSDDEALTAIMSPPLRAAADADALPPALADGRLGWLATDHCEFTLEQKRAGAADGFPGVPNGGSGVGERLIVAYTLGVTAGLLTPERWVEVCCEAPARAMGLGRKGRIEVGMDADLVLFDPDAEGTRLPVNADNSLWQGEMWRGAVHHVWLRGRRVVRSGRLVAQEPGAHVSRSFA